MGVGAAFVQGWQRVWRARVLAGGILLTTGTLATFVPVAGGAALGPASRATGLALAAGVELRLGTIDAPHAPTWALALHLGASLLLLGALLAGLAPAHPPGIRACLGAGAVRVFRFLRLGLVASMGGLAAAALLIASPNAPGVFLALSVLFVVSLFVSYAEVRLVVEDRRTVLGALVAGGRFVHANPAATLGLHVLNATVCAVAFLPLIWLAPPTDAQASPAALATTLALFPVVLVQLQWSASQMALFQERLGTE